MPKLFSSLFCRGLVVFSFLSVLGCGSGGSGSDSEPEEVLPEPEEIIVEPVISEVYTDIFHYHPSFFLKWSQVPRALNFTFLVRIEDELGSENLSRAYITDKTNDLSFDLIDADDGLSVDYFYNDFFDAFQLFSFNPGSLDRVELNNWEIYAEDEQGNSTTREFNFKLPDGIEPGSEEYVYGADYSSPDLSGVAAMEAMNVASNSLSFAKNTGSQAFEIDFEVTDDRAESYIIWFYDNSADFNYLGRASYLTSASIDSTPINPSGITQLQLPWSELSIDPDDVGGIHIALMDESTELTLDEGNRWNAYIGVSEYLSL